MEKQNIEKQIEQNKLKFMKEKGFIGFVRAPQERFQSCFFDKYWDYAFEIRNDYNKLLQY